ncbi:hypothetical protein MASR1M66_20940 [Aminivibrio sp.]
MRARSFPDVMDMSPSFSARSPKRASSSGRQKGFSEAVRRKVFRSGFRLFTRASWRTIRSRGRLVDPKTP